MASFKFLEDEYLAIQCYPHIATKMNLMQTFVNILNIEQRLIQN